MACRLVDANSLSEPMLAPDERDMMRISSLLSMKYDYNVVKHRQKMDPGKVGYIFGMVTTNESRCYFVTHSLIGQVHT